MAAISLSSGKILIGVALAAAAALGWFAWTQNRDDGPGPGFASGNGRIEATEIDIATRQAGRVQEILVREGDFVQAGQVLARMQAETLRAQHDEANASRQEAIHAVSTAEAQVALRQSDVAATRAGLAEREAELDAARRRLARTETLAREGAASLQELDDNRSRARGAEAGVNAARAQVVAAQAAVEAARTQKTGAAARVTAMEATVARIDADIRDSDLRSPRDGRVQLRVAQPGEVLAAGGRLLNLLDLSDVYMTFFLPATQAGRIALGSEARIVLDAAPQFVIPAQVSFIASSAQFTPKSVETASEREKLMFRIRVKIPEKLLQKHLSQVKTGLPGVAWVRLDSSAPWPPALTPRVPE